MRISDWSSDVCSSDLEGSRLAFALAAPNPANRALIPNALREAPEGSVVEVCPAALSIAAFLGHRLARQPGAALVIDYGPAQPTAGATLQAQIGRASCRERVGQYV